MTNAQPEALYFTGDEDADRFLAQSPLAVLIGMLLDQQVPMEWAFRSPSVLRERLGGDLEADRITATDPEKLVELFSEKPALHRFPGSMAKRVHALCEHLIEHYDGRAEAVWEGVEDARELLRRLQDLPGFGREKSRVFVAVLGRRLGVQPDGWEEVAADWPTVADADRPGAIEQIREAKAAWKASKKAQGTRNS